MTRRALTVVELLCVVAIICFLAALFQPVMTKALISAKVTSSAQRLHQLYVGLMIYQSDWEPGGGYGSPAEMGLPDGLYLYGGPPDTYSVVTNSVEPWFSACGRHPSLTVGWDPTYTNIYNVTNLEGWNNYYRENQERALLVADPNCNTADISAIGEGSLKRIVGVNLGGTVQTRWTYHGLFDDDGFYGWR